MLGMVFSLQSSDKKWEYIALLHFPQTKLSKKSKFQPVYKKAFTHCICGFWLAHILNSYFHQKW